MLFGSRRNSWRIWLIMGLGLCLYGYYDWQKLDIPDEQTLQQAIEEQYEAELVRLQQHAGDTPVQLTPEWQAKFRTAIRNERMAPVEKARRRIQSTIGFGLLVTVIACGMFVMSHLSERQAGGKP